HQIGYSPLVNRPRPVETESSLIHAVDVDPNPESVVPYNARPRLVVADVVHEPNNSTPDLLCWWCAHAFDKTGVGIPFRVDDDPYTGRSELKPAPEKEVLRAFGGPMTIEDFRGSATRF
ncbi:hypothetical protein HK102_011333, partial [Quaeritorhiza haematococci]